MSEEEVNAILRQGIALHDLYFRHGYDILEDRKMWFENKISNENIFIGFFEKRRCMLSDFEIDFLINLMLKSRWDMLENCFEMIYANGDVCRTGSLLSFISDSVQSFRRKYTYSSVNIEDGIFNLKIDIQSSVFCGREYTELSSINQLGLMKFKEVLNRLHVLIPTDSRDSKLLDKYIDELNDRIE